MQQACQLLNDSSFGTALRGSTPMFPALETVHVLAIAHLVGTVAIPDLRLLGVLLNDEPVPGIVSNSLITYQLTGHLLSIHS